MFYYFFFFYFIIKYFEDNIFLSQRGWAGNYKLWNPSINQIEVFKPLVDIFRKRIIIDYVQLLKKR